MKEYYKLRWYWVFNYTSKNFGYCLLKTLCLVIGLPIYSVMFALEMVLTAVNMLFCWIPILNTVIFIICKSLMVAFGSTFYLTILTDIKKYKEAAKQEVEYEVVDAEVTNETAEQTELLADAAPDETPDNEEK